MDLLRQVRRGRLTRVLVPLLAAAAIPATATAQADSETFRETTKIEGLTLIAPNPCSTPAETVTFKGTIVAGDHTTVDSSGGVHEESIINAHFTGKGPLTGLAYEFKSSVTATENLTVDGATEYTTEFFDVMVNTAGEKTETVPGMGNDFFLRVMMHVTVNANGVPTALVEIDRTGCR
jgi:hypothetical protein